MRLIFGLVLVLGVALAGGAVYLAKNQMGAYQARLSAAERARAQMIKTVEVLVLTKALRYGDQMTAEDVRVVKWPEDAIPEGAFMKPKICSLSARTSSVRFCARWKKTRRCWRSR